MQSIKANLTRFKNKIIDIFPDNQDVFGFQGVSKSGIVELIERAYGHVSRLEELPESISIVALKRKLTPAYDRVRKYLENYSDVVDKKESERFNAFLNDVTLIHDEIVLTYYIFSDKSVREIADLENKIDFFSKNCLLVEKLDSGVSKLSEELEEAEEALRSILKHSENIDEIYQNTETRWSEIEGLKSKASASREVILKYEIEARGAKSNIEELFDKLAVEAKKLSGLNSSAQKIKSEIEKLKTSAEEANDVNKRQQEIIDTTLTLASKYGMAASFKERKDELIKPMKMWGIAFVAAIIALVITGVSYIVTGDGISELGVQEIVVRVGIVAPQVWLGWMAAKQYSYISRIREDYSFKYASALAFEGYKKEACDVDINILRDLLNVATLNMALNPLRIYDESSVNCHSPISEALQMILHGNKKKPVQESKE